SLALDRVEEKTAGKKRETKMSRENSLESCGLLAPERFFVDREQKKAFFSLKRCSIVEEDGAFC
ncbi:MAG: hypothetical protein D3910_17140, partial [Candidatus Electrothrix sp. ATG2]|nr:hypothetical protein [Candidatus Electrothrix sp. ATG2]